MALMENWICLHCKKVLGSFSAPRCHKKDMTLFSAADHGAHLIGLSNSWLSVDLHQDHPLYRRALEEFHHDGNYGASSIFNRFVDLLIEAAESEPAEKKRT